MKSGAAVFWILIRYNTNYELISGIKIPGHKHVG